MSETAGRVTNGSFVALFQTRPHRCEVKKGMPLHAALACIFVFFFLLDTVGTPVHAPRL